MSSDIVGTHIHTHISAQVDCATVGGRLLPHFMSNGYLIFKLILKDFNNKNGADTMATAMATGNNL